MLGYHWAFVRRRRVRRFLAKAFHTLPLAPFSLCESSAVGASQAVPRPPCNELCPSARPLCDDSLFSIILRACVVSFAARPTVRLTGPWRQLFSQMTVHNPVRYQWLVCGSASALASIESNFRSRPSSTANEGVSPSTKQYACKRSPSVIFAIGPSALVSQT